jgi:sugar transferase (PEP-CTERM system associated)
MVVRVFNSYIPLRRLAFCLLEGLSLVFIFWLFSHGNPGRNALVLNQFLFFSIFIQVMFFYFEMYEADFFTDLIFMAKRLFLALACAFVFWLFFFSSSQETKLNTILISLAASGMIGFTLRILYRSWADTAKNQSLLIIGSGNIAKGIAVEVLRKKDSGFQVLGFISEAPGRTGERLVNPSILGDYAHIDNLVRRMNVDRVIVALEDRRGLLPLEPLLECKLRGIAVEDGFEFFERFSGKLHLEYLRPSSIIFSAGYSRSAWMKHACRLVSVCLSIAGAIILAPFALITALLIKLESPGPVVYRQERVGEGGRPFTLLKFRSMRVNAEENGPAWASQDDPRVTKVGKWIRKLRFDEIPQLWNVLCNDMALVGPRPERQHFVDQLQKEIHYYGQRFAVKPGITGWAQINYPYGASKEDALEKLKYDLFYIKHYSVGFDLYIILQTIKIVLFRKGSR